MTESNFDDFQFIHISISNHSPTRDSASTWPPSRWTSPPKSLHVQNSHSRQNIRHIRTIHSHPRKTEFYPITLDFVTKALISIRILQYPLCEYGAGGRLLVTEWNDLWGWWLARSRQYHRRIRWTWVWVPRPLHLDSNCMKSQCFVCTWAMSWCVDSFYCPHTNVLEYHDVPSKRRPCIDLEAHPTCEFPTPQAMSTVSPDDNNMIGILQTKLI